MKKVMSGKVLDAIKSVLNLIDKGLESLINLGMDVKDRKEQEDGSILYTIYAGNDDSIVFYVKVSESPNSSKVTVECTDKKRHKNDKYENVDPNKVDKVIQKFCEKSYGVDAFAVEEGVKSSIKFQVGLQRVASSKHDDIQMTSIYCNSGVGRYKSIMSSIDSMLDDVEFVDSLPEDEPIVFDVVDNGEDILVEEADECKAVENPYILALAAAYSLLNVCTAVHWNSIGQNFADIHGMSDNFIYAIRSQIDSLGEMCVEHCSSIPSPFTIIADGCPSDIQTDTGFTLDLGVVTLQNAIEEYVACLEVIYCSVPHDVGLVLDNWIRDWNLQMNYFLKQRTR